MTRTPGLRWSALLLALGALLWAAWRPSGGGADSSTIGFEARDGRPVRNVAHEELAALTAPERDAPSSREAAIRGDGATSGEPAPAATPGLRGRVVDASGAAVEGALVALLSLHDGAPGSRGARETTRSEASGEFALEVPEWAAGARVLLAARHGGDRPFSAEVELDEAFVSRTHELAVGVGYEISGQVVRDGAPVADAHVSIDAAYGTGGVFGAGSEAWWANGRLEEKHGEVRTDPDGTFRITGLGPVPYRVNVHAQQGDLPRIASHVFAVEAPDARVYDLTGARVAVTVVDASGPVSGAQVHVSSAGHGIGVESADAPVVVEVPPYAKIAVDVTHPLSHPVRAELDSLGARSQQECVVRLDTVTRPSLTAFVPGADRARIERLRLQLESHRGDSKSELLAFPTGATDSFRVPVVPLDPGSYTLILEPDDRSGTGNYVAPRVQELELPASGNVHVEFLLDLCGRCDVRIISPREGDWSAILRVVDSEGDTVYERHRFHSEPQSDDFGEWEEIEWEEVEDETSLIFDLDAESMLRGVQKFRTVESADDVARRCGVVPAGAYTLEVESGGHSRWRGPITVEAGKTTRVDVQLVRAD